MTHTKYSNINSEFHIYKQIFDNAMNIILVVAHDGKILMANNQAVDSYGYSRDELLNLTIYDLRKGDTFEHVNNQMSIALKNGISFEAYHYRKDGSRFPVQVNSISMNKDNKKIISMIRDITEKRLQEEKMRLNEERLRFALESGDYGVFDINLADNKIYYSDKMKEMFGFNTTSFDEVQSIWMSRIHPDDHRRVNEELAKIHTKNGYSSEYRIINNDGTYRWIRARMKPVSWLPDGKQIRFVGLCEDITSRKKIQEDLKESEEQFRMLFNSMSQTVSLHEVVRDQNGEPYDYRFIDINPLFERIQNKKKADVVGKTLSEVYPNSKLEVVTHANMVMAIGEPVYYEKYHEGVDRYYGIYICRFQSNKIAVLTTDITDKKKKETLLENNYKKLFSLYEKLSDSQEQLKNNLKQMEILRESAERANEAKSQFLANMSHEIRTPMHVILGTTELLELTGLNDRQKECTSLLKSSAHSLLQIINNILDISKIESGSLELSYSPFNIKSNIEEIIKELKPIVHDKNLDIRFFIEPDVTESLIGDSLRLNQILLNLLNNSIKFTDSGSITLGVKREWDDSSKIMLQFSVKDTGIGISNDIRKKIFEPFTQGDISCTKKYAGTGLGLTISKELIEKMKGNIWFESRLGEGTTFYFTAEFDKDTNIDKQASTAYTKEESVSEAAVSSAKENYLILCVEDNPANQQILTMFLNSKGYDCICSDNGRKALEFLNHKTPDLILMDVQMPEMNGFDTTLAIRESEKETGKHIPIIAMTAYAMAGDDKKCLNAGMDDYISKPTDLNALHLKIQKFM